MPAHPADEFLTIASVRRDFARAKALLFEEFLVRQKCADRLSLKLKSLPNSEALLPDIAIESVRRFRRR